MAAALLQNKMSVNIDNRNLIFDYIKVYRGQNNHNICWRAKL